MTLFQKARDFISSPRVHYVVIDSRTSACGLPTSEKTGRLHSSDPESVTCPTCLATDECAAQRMEDAISAKGAVHYINVDSRSPACGIPNVSGTRTTANIRITTCTKCLDSTAGRTARRESA